MIPISDDHPTSRAPIVTYALLALITASWIIVQAAGSQADTLAASICTLGLVPGELTGLADLGTALYMGSELYCVVDADPVNWITPISSMFLHGDWAHLLGNMLFLYVFGDNVEDRMGRGRFALFYLTCGLVAAAAQVASSPSSPIPMVGASGAISGVMGAYLVLFPRVRVRMLFIIVVFIRIIPVPAWFVLVWWFVLQLLGALPAITGAGAVHSGVAVWAHLGGFAAGAGLVKLFDPG